MTKITEAEFARLVNGILDDRDSIIKHNPIGTNEEVLLWMLLSVLVHYLNLTDVETPCFSGRPTADTYREAIEFVMSSRKQTDFAVTPYLDSLRS